MCSQDKYLSLQIETMKKRPTAMDVTPNIENTSRQENMLLKENMQAVSQQEQQVEQTAATAVQCPHCGATNELEAVFCASCGQAIGSITCPNCGNVLDADADFCEMCHRYIKHDICSFCGAHLTGQEAYCPECGNPRGGIVCPTCHTLNDFAFCKRCGTPLTDEASTILAEVKATPEYEEMTRLTKEYDDLCMELPYSSQRDLVRDEDNDKLRERVLFLLARDEGADNPVITKKEKKRLSKEEQHERKEKLLEKISAMMDKMATPPAISPAKVRNYAMASKPVGVRLAWICNYKHAMHSSPCGCAKPQFGGKWVILGKNTKENLVDDNK